MTELRVELFSAFRVSVGSRVLADEEWHQRKPAALSSCSP
jgi:hypothetical protein